MAITKVLARDWIVEIETGEVPAFTPIKGLVSLSFDSDKGEADTTTFDEMGRKSHMVASRGNSLSLEGQYLEDEATGTRDPGQAAIEDLADKIGPSSLGTFQLTSPGGTVRTFLASASVSGIGGGNDDPTGWKVDVVVSGSVTVAPAV